ncbi:hypothetical protein F2Q70_00013031 [Brassica cretica]|uniref:Uncharacterized protein n=1 Tax=Brassica cretica TaxID=69181 RepID=A0A8S9M1M3_BRACR|nr:hypothetical protein F2Q70_00013031 [Brassica cretica]
MGNGSWSRRRHMTEARSSTEAGRRVVRQVRQVVMQYLLFRCSKGCVMIIHEEADGWGCISHGGEEHGDRRPEVDGAYLMGEKSMVWCTSRGGEKHN